MISLYNLSMFFFDLAFVEKYINRKNVEFILKDIAWQQAKLSNEDQGYSNRIRGKNDDCIDGKIIN